MPGRKTMLSDTAQEESKPTFWLSPAGHDTLLQRAAHHTLWCAGGVCEAGRAHYGHRPDAEVHMARRRSL